MEKQSIISKMNEFLHIATSQLASWLSNKLCRISDDWWRDCVMDKLSYNQRNMAIEKRVSRLEEFDLAALLRIADRNWYGMRDFMYLPTSERECIREMLVVRNNWAHVSGQLPPKEDIIHDAEIIKAFFEQLATGEKDINTVRCFIEELTVAEDNSPEETDTAVNTTSVTSTAPQKEITEKSLVYLIGQPDTVGMVFSVENIGNTKKYKVFINGALNTFYSEQIALVDDAPNYSWIDLQTLQSYLSAFEINNPSSGSLYSLNSARIDFVPYQFRPALKLIKSDEPRILIADSVGVGKTIEAGLIIKELEARNELENVMIICPKPLVSERKWALEMKRFDEDFVPLTGADLRQIINDTDRDGEWPSRYGKTIVPYSILDGRVYNGDDSGRVTQTGLLDLDPAPHFDLVIVDEAHHIRNGSLDKEKAFAYKCVKYICDHADAVVMLTATPLQTGDDDLFTLLNVLRPDVVIDKAAFTLMSQPNTHIFKAASIIRSAKENWQIRACEELNGIFGTQWGENVISENPLFTSVVKRLESENLSREDRVQLITDVESLHSFNTMINRTRRRDIQDFCIRRPYTVQTEFTPEQRELHDELLSFERLALSTLHNVRCVPFMMSTIRRQAASCIFGLAPHIRDIIARRFRQLADDPDVDTDEFDLDFQQGTTLQRLAARVLELADNLPEKDTKFESLLSVIESKQNEDNNKIIIFSTYRYTLRYIKEKLLSLGYRVEPIDGNVKDEERCELRNRFELAKDNERAIDILMFTEVGSEGLDYQFCNTMINYDLPWNPMRIEQRIGRIDRRGQASEYVNIYNMITSGTVDADIYERCLMRIGVFERSIGECEEILGEIGSEVERIAMNIHLTDEERRMKLEQMADNEVRKVQELNRLEDEEKELFGFDLSSQTMAREVQDAESPWLSQKNLISLVNMYLNERVGKGKYILGDSEAKTLRLSVEARGKLREDLNKLTGVSSSLRRKWEVYLKGTVPTHAITFDSDYASKDRNAFFITAVHPLVKQAAAHFAVNTPTYVNISYSSEALEPGEYAFSIYAWNYVGFKSHFSLVSVCENEDVPKEFTDIIRSGSTRNADHTDYSQRWEALEEKHIALWDAERKKNMEDAKLVASYKIQSLENSYNSRRITLEEKIREAYDENIRRMRMSELENATERHHAKVESIKRQIAQADIHTTLIANGIIRIN